MLGQAPRTEESSAMLPLYCNNTESANSMCGNRMNMLTGYGVHCFERVEMASCVPFPRGLGTRLIHYSYHMVGYV